MKNLTRLDKSFWSQPSTNSHDQTFLLLEFAFVNGYNRTSLYDAKIRPQEITDGNNYPIASMINLSCQVAVFAFVLGEFIDRS